MKYKKNITRLINYVKMLCYINEIKFVIVCNEKIVFIEQGSNDTRIYAINKHDNSFLEINDDLFYFLLFPLNKDKVQNIIAGRRIVTNSRIKNLVNGIFKKYQNFIPTFILVIYDEVDVNISVDKTEVIFKNFKFIENKIITEIELYLSQQIHISKVESSNILKITNFTIEDINLKNDEFNTITSIDDSLTENSIIQDNKGGSIISSDNKNDEFNIITSIDDSLTENSIIQDNKGGSIISSDNKNDEFNTITSIDDSLTENSIIQDNKWGSIISNDNNIVSNDNNIVSNLYEAYKYIKEECLEYPDIIIKKEDFKNMKIIGQFNKGFILCEIEKNNQNYLITVDQHAADEIYHFEELVDNFYFKKQNLITPINLELSVEKQFILEENQNILEKNGFVVRNNQLLTFPVYKGHFFGILDFYTLIDNISNGFYELEKFRNIMASKACRTSVMIGEALNEKSMKNILNNLARLKQPWNCPHGRPTFKIITKL